MQIITELQALADVQGGLFTTRQAAALGVDEAALARLRAGKQVAGLARSLYALPQVVPTDPVALHRLRSAGALLVYPDAHLCGLSALIAADVDTWGASLARVDLARPVRREVLTALCRIRPPHPGIRVPPGEPTHLAGAVVQNALDHGHFAGVVSADDVVCDERVSEEEIREAFASIERWRGASRARTMLAFMDGRAQSVGETRLRLMLTASGIRVVPQFPIVDRRGRTFAYTDLLVDGTNLCLEFDGQVKYGGSEPEVLWREKKREDSIRREGYRMERVIWAEVERPKVLLARIRHEISLSEPRPSVLDAGGVRGA